MLLLYKIHFFPRMNNPLWTCRGLCQCCEGADVSVSLFWNTPQSIFCLSTLHCKWRLTGFYWWLSAALLCLNAEVGWRGIFFILDKICWFFLRNPRLGDVTQINVLWKIYSGRSSAYCADYKLHPIFWFSCLIFSAGAVDCFNCCNSEKCFSCKKKSSSCKLLKSAEMQWFSGMFFNPCSTVQFPITD